MGSQRVGHDWATKHSTANELNVLDPCKCIKYFISLKKDYQSRQIFKWNRIKCPEMNPYIYSQGQLVLDKRAENTQWRTGSSFNKWFWENRMLTSKRMKLDPYLTALKTTELKWSKHLKVRFKGMVYCWTKLSVLIYIFVIIYMCKRNSRKKEQ